MTRIPDYYINLAISVDAILNELKRQPAALPGAINWANLHCASITECKPLYPANEDKYLLILIEEADPAAIKLHDAVEDGLFAKGYTKSIVVETAW